MDFKKAIDEVKSKSKKRRFVQSIDMIINFKGIDFSKPNNRINLEVILPKGRGKKVRIAAIVGDALITEAKEKADTVIKSDEIESFGKNKKKIKKLANEHDFFLCQTDLMKTVGKFMGQVLAPRDKMPQPVPPTAKLEPFIRRFEKLIKIKMKGKFVPTIHAVVGTEEMGDEDLVVNAETVYDAVKEKLPNKEGNIKSVYMKTTMGKSVKVE